MVAAKEKPRQTLNADLEGLTNEDDQNEHMKEDVKSMQ